jgi:ATP-dependent Clp protease protease subunit
VSSLKLCLKTLDDVMLGCLLQIKPAVSTVCFGIAASQGALLLAGGEKGKRFAMPNARIMIHQPQGGCGGTVDDVRRQVNEVMTSRDVLSVPLFFTHSCTLSNSYSTPSTILDIINSEGSVWMDVQKLDKMYSAFTGQPLERVQKFTDRDRFFSAAEAMEFGLIDGLLETEY